MFDMNVKTNFLEAFNYYLKMISMFIFFCDYILQSQVLKIFENEITKHMEDNHENIITVFKADNTEIDNLTHLEFLELLSLNNC